ncbi:MAG: preprotein translocase subunit SecY [Eubacteriales bacterium]
MFKTLRDSWKVLDIRKKILYTLLMLFVYRLGVYVSIPGISLDVVEQQISNSTLLTFLSLLSGGGLDNMSIFAQGITPYINASIIMNLLTVAIPALERLQKEGQEGQKKISNITRYVAVGIGLVQATAILISFINAGAIDPTVFNIIMVLLCLTAGTALVMWIGERITEKGIGNGISLLIFVSIISRLPSAIYDSIAQVAAGTQTIIETLMILALALLVVTGITFVDMGERRIPVQYAKRVVGRKMYGGQSTHIPMRVNQSGVIPIIFAITLINFPIIITEMVAKDSSLYQFLSNNFSSNGASPVYLITYALLILFFTYFYSQITFNPVDVAKNMQQYAGFIPGIRSGKPTSDYLHKILSRITLFGALFLALVAVIPTMINATLFSIFGATSLMIMVSVSLETTKQLESQMMMRHYKGFLK